MNGDFENVLDGDYTAAKVIEQTGMWYFWEAIKSCCPGHGEEYYYEDDGTWTSLCLALPPPDPNVRFVENTF